MKKQGGRGRGRVAGGPNPVDRHVGSRVRRRRTILGLSQEMLGEALGMSFQQVQKYESGANRISASRLFDLTRILDVPSSYFFEDMPKEIAAHSPGQLQGTEGSQPTIERDPMARRETLELMRAYYRITDPKARKKLFEMTKAVAAYSEQRG